MTVWFLAAILVLAFLGSGIMTGLVRRYAIARALLDHPNERSSHTVPTPRGGGLAVVCVVLGGVAAFAAAGRITPELAAALAGGALVALVGWLDDRRTLSAKLRLLAHVFAAAWAVYWLHGMPSLRIGGTAVALGGVGAGLAVLSIVWATNLYNFMDGIDGLAASEAVTVGLAAGLLLWPHAPALGGLAVLTAGAAGGFLVWNWAPARIFLGDVGSGFLGYHFAVLALASENTGAVPALVWVLLLGVFFVDAMVTLGRRIAAGERWYAAHRSHAYQRATRQYGSARPVVAAVLGLNAVLAFLAWLAVRWPGQLVPALVIGCLMLGVIYVLVERRCPMYGASGRHAPGPAGR